MFSNLISLTLGWDNLNDQGTSVTKIVKEIKFEGASSNLQSRTRFQRQ